MILVFFEAVLDRRHSKSQSRLLAIVLRWMRRRRGLEIEIDRMDVPDAHPLDDRRMRLKARVDALVSEVNANLPPELHINHRRTR